jgi:L-lactate permease
MAAQDGGAAIGSVASPAKLQVWANTVSMAGREGKVLQASAATTGTPLVLLSLIAWMLILLGWG